MESRAWTGYVKVKRKDIAQAVGAGCSSKLTKWSWFSRGTLMDI